MLGHPKTGLSSRHSGQTPYRQGEASSADPHLPVAKAKVSFDAVQSYEGPADPKVVKWTTEHSGTILSFPELRTITGPASGSGYLQLTAASGSRILMPRLQVITKASDGSSTIHSRVILKSSSSGSMVYAPALYIFSDNDVSPQSEIDQGTGSTIFVGRLGQQGVRGVTLIGVTLPATSPIPDIALRRSGANWSVAVPALSGKSYQLRKSAALGSGSWTSQGGAVAGNNDWLLFPVSPDGPKGFFLVDVSP